MMSQLPPQIQVVHENIKAIVNESGTEESGPLFLYAAGHGMGWHTNLDNEEPLGINTSHSRPIRMYIVQNLVGGVDTGFFLYRHPYSGKIHAVPDRSGYVNVFDLRDAVSPIWLAVVCLRGCRISYGMRMSRTIAKSLRIPLPAL